MTLRSAIGISALKSYVLWLCACSQRTKCSKWFGCLLYARYLLGAENRKERKTWPLPSGSLKSAAKDLWCGIFSNSCWNTKIHLHLIFLIHKAPNNCPQNPLLLLLRNIPFNLRLRLPWLQFTCDSYNICLILKFIWQLFEIPGIFSTFSLFFQIPRGWRKLISCVKMWDDSRSKVKPIYKGDRCQCLE